MTINARSLSHAQLSAELLAGAHEALADPGKPAVNARPHAIRRPPSPPRFAPQRSRERCELLSRLARFNWGRLRDGGGGKRGLKGIADHLGGMAALCGGRLASDRFAAAEGGRHLGGKHFPKLGAAFGVGEAGCRGWQRPVNRIQPP